MQGTLFEPKQKVSKATYGFRGKIVVAILPCNSGKNLDWLLVFFTFRIIISSAFASNLDPLLCRSLSRDCF